jgi:hypothetical protein
MRCLSCKYDLRRLPAGSERWRACPECGREFDPGDSSTFDPQRRRKPLPRWRFLVITFASLLLMIILYGIVWIVVTPWGD